MAQPVHDTHGTAKPYGHPSVAAAARAFCAVLRRVFSGSRMRAGKLWTSTAAGLDKAEQGRCFRRIGR